MISNKEFLILLDILEKHSFIPYAQELVLVLENANYEAINISKSEIPIEEVKSIATKRLRLKTKRNYSIYGFEILLVNLENTESKMVTILNLENDNQHFDIFTDISSETLFGIVSVEAEIS